MGGGREGGRGTGGRTIHRLRKWKKTRRFSVCPVEDVGDVAGEFEVLLLVVADGDMCGPLQNQNQALSATQSPSKLRETGMVGTCRPGCLRLEGRGR